mmetsp:Transcript_10402/g.29382  ORF Transcript_10402/g.29382 Transcript_10402/m.29382 type:complete len:373 (+) Transcript_10402:313-1431(+)
MHRAHAPRAHALACARLPANGDATEGGAGRNAVDGEEVHIEDKLGVGRDQLAAPGRAVPRLGGDDQLRALAEGHHEDALLQPRDHRLLAQGEREGLAVHEGGVELLLRAADLPDEVDGHRVAPLGLGEGVAEPDRRHLDALPLGDLVRNRPVGVRRVDEVRRDLLLGQGRLDEEHVLLVEEVVRRGLLAHLGREPRRLGPRLGRGPLLLHAGLLGPDGSPDRRPASDGHGAAHGAAGGLRWRHPLLLLGAEEVKDARVHGSPVPAAQRRPREPRRELAAARCGPAPVRAGEGERGDAGAGQAPGQEAEAESAACWPRRPVRRAALHGKLHVEAEGGGHACQGCSLPVEAGSWGHSGAEWPGTGARAAGTKNA